MAGDPAPKSGEPETLNSRDSLSSSGIPARFEILRRLGTGGFGAVFLVRDQETGVEVALKRLSRVDPASIYRFKQEFRSLKGHVHPNLVRIHELIAVDESWCFTMDAIDGVRFDAWIRGDSALRIEDTVSTQQTSETQEHGEAPVYNPKSGKSSGIQTRTGDGYALEEARLREAMRQLVHGVLELHSLGVLHRDLKPSNVLVDAQGRVVILDFGLAVDVQSHPKTASTAGTPAYMSPEQARGAMLTMASDWYSVGVMLYQGLTGQLPYVGTPKDMLQARQQRPPRRPEQLAPSLPSDLCDLTMDLLRIEAMDRPNGFNVATRLGLTPSLAASPHHVEGGVFIGRENETLALHMAFEESRRGNTVVAHVHGPSGFGKTTAIGRFVAELTRQDHVIVLEGRSYERESVPFKALDELVDALGRYLDRLKPVEAAALMPRDTRSLLRLFPSLGRLDLLSEVRGRAPSTDMHELRRRAFGALREILTRITDTKTLVLVLDDVHWGDRDSADLIRNLLAPPDVPPLLLIAGYRNESREENELLRTLRSPHAADAEWQSVDIPIGALPASEARQLAHALLPSNSARESLAELIAAESAGSPLFVAELVRASKRSGAQEPAVSMRNLVATRTEGLTSNDRLLLIILACSERPLPEAALCAVSELPVAAIKEGAKVLRDEHLAKVSTVRGKPHYLTFHAKIRKAALAGASPSHLRRVHHSLALHFEEQKADAESIAHHYLEASRKVEALGWFETAGDSAASSAAFNHAVRNYRRALSLTLNPVDIQRIHRKLAPALSRAGQGPESAAVYLQVAQHDEEDRNELIRRAGTELLRAGHTDDALDTLAPLLESHRLELPGSGKRALFSLLYRRARLKMRGLKFKERNDAEPQALEAIDLCWALGNGLAGIDLIRSAHYNSLGLWLALEAGEPRRVARSMALDATLRNLEGGEAVAASAPMLEQAEELATRMNDPHSLGWVAAARAVGAFSNTELRAVPEQCASAVELMREDSEETFREIGSLTVWFWLHATFLLGQLDELREKAPEVAREAEARGDRYTLSTIRAYVLPLHFAAQGRPDEARRLAREAIRVWPEDAWFHQHWAHLRAECFLDLYEGKGSEILARIESARPKMKSSYQLRIRTPRLELNYLEGRALLEEALQSGLSRSLSRSIGEKVVALQGEGNGLATAYGQTLETALMTLQSPKSGPTLFQSLAENFKERGMRLHAAGALLRHGELLGGDEGAAIVVAQKENLSRLGVRDPHAFSTMLVPRVSASGESE